MVMKMRQIAYFAALTLLLCSLCACGNNKNTVGDTTSGNFSTEMMIEPSTDVTIVEMP